MTNRYYGVEVQGLALKRSIELQKMLLIEAAAFSELTSKYVHELVTARAFKTPAQFGDTSFEQFSILLNEKENEIYCLKLIYDSCEDKNGCKQYVSVDELSMHSDVQGFTEYLEEFLKNLTPVA